MTELFTLLAICTLDWVVAQRAMAYTYTEVKVYNPNIDLTTYSYVAPTWLPWYEKKALGTDYFHLTGWIRYPALTWFAWGEFGMDWRWYLATAIVNALGWGLLKVIHGKADTWGLAPRWLKQLMGRS